MWSVESFEPEQRGAIGSLGNHQPPLQEETKTAQLLIRLDFQKPEQLEKTKH